MTNKPHIAIIADDVFAGIGLKTFLEEIISFAQIDYFQSVESALEFSEINTIYHYFISAELWISCSKTLAPFKRLIIVFGKTELQKDLPDDIHFISSDSSREKVAKSLLRLQDMAHHQFQHYPQNVSKQLKAEEQKQRAMLSDREIKIIKMIASGKNSKEIAKMLHISAATVYTHRQHIMEKLNAHSAMKVVHFAINQGYIDMDKL